MQQSGSGWTRKYPIKLPSESSIHSSGSSGSLKSDAEEEAYESSSFEVQTTSTYYSEASRSERLADVGIAPVLISESPRIIVVDNFLTNNECDNIMRLARPDLRRSRVASGLEIEGRTSSGTFLTGRKEKDRTVVTIEKKIADFMNNTSVRELYDWHNHPLMRAEAMQVVKYETGQFYHEHYDNKAGQTSMRAATFMMYLSDSEGGGATYFPRAIPLEFDDDACGPRRPNSPSTATSSSGMDQNSLLWGNDGVYRTPDPGIRIVPRKGRAVLFWSKKPDGCEDLNSIHAAETVMRGEKWIATRWLSEKSS